MLAGRRSNPPAYLDYETVRKRPRVHTRIFNIFDIKKGVIIVVNFPEPIRNLPEADIPLQGIKAFLAQGQNHQIIFMEFSEDIDLAEHNHESQWGIVLEGEIELVINGIKNRFKKGDRYFIPKGVMHSGKIFAGYADITFFNQKDRYGMKK